MRTRREKSWVVPSRLHKSSHALRLAAVLVSLALSCLVRLAIAQSSNTILLSDRGSEELVRKIRAEAAHVGLAVVEVRAPGGAANDQELVRTYAALALVRVVSPVEVELVVGDEAKTLAAQPAESAAFAVRVVEELRARLVELRLWAPTKRPESVPPPPSAAVDAARSTTAPTPPPPAVPPKFPAASANPVVVDRGASDAPNATPGPRLWLGGGAAALAPTGGIGPTALGYLGVGAEPFADWTVLAIALLPLTDNDVDRAEGAADVDLSVFLAQLAYSADLSDDWPASAGIGAGLLSLSMRAEPASGFIGRDDRLLAGVYYVHAGIGRRLSPFVRIATTVMGGLASPRPVLRFDDRDVAAWGPYFGGVALRVEVGVPLIREGAR